DCATIEGCDDVDADGICDDVDDCVGEYDCAGECNGDAVEDNCGVCGGEGQSCDQFISLSIGSVENGVMEIIMENTMPIAGFQFELTGVALATGACSGGSAGDGDFQVSYNETGMVLGFSMTGTQIPAGNGVLTNVAYTATGDESCITNEILALGDWPGGLYEINIGECAALDDGGGTDGGDDGGGEEFLGCLDESACNYDDGADTDDGSCYYDEAGCTASISDDCEAAGGVAGYTAAGCVTLATSDDFLASCEAQGVEASILSAC
ncbi:uncharacterized protein METZ01_LOCUS431760, partial [marine metagenome]